MAAVEPVLVVGAGPVGLAVASVLATAGVDVLVFEAGPHPSTEWRASTFHPPTVELLAEVGIVDEMLRIGLRAPRFQFRDRTSGVVAEFDMTILADDTPYPFRLQVAQNNVAFMLARVVQEAPTGSVRFGARAVGVESDAEGAALEIETAAGRERVRGRFVLGADGATSIVRKSLEVPFTGMTYEERFLIVTTTIAFDDYLPDIADVNYVADPKEFAFLLHTPDGWRALFPIPAEEPAELALSEAEIQRRLHGLIPFDGDFPLLDRRIYTVHQRVAETFRVGSVLLLGDAAHINSPMGGLGLNSGVHDAFDLGRRLVRIVKGEAEDPGLELDTYARLRREVALEYVKRITHRNTRWLLSRDPGFRRQLDAELRATAADPTLAREWLLDNSLIRAVREQGIGTPAG